MNRPNIFRYAKRELSQDAIVCWLLKCLHSEEEKYKKIGLNFIRFIFKDETIADDEVTLDPDSPYNQHHHMDVYAVVCVRGALHPIIFENKTNTYLHSEQFKKYCKQVSDRMSPKDPYFNSLKKAMNHIPQKWGNIIYVFFKTGYMHYHQKKDFDRQAEAVQNEFNVDVREIYLNDIVDFLSKQQRDWLLDDYFEVLNKQKENRDFAISNTMLSTDLCFEALDDKKGNNEVACSLLLKESFGIESSYNYNHQHWASRDLFEIFDNDKNKTCYCFRLEWCCYKRKCWAPAFQLQQYRKESDISSNKGDALKNKVEEANEIQDICQSIIKSMKIHNVEIRMKDLNSYPCKSFDSQMLMKVFIFGDSTPTNVCNFIKEFSEKLRNEIKQQKGNNVILLEYNN